MQQKIRLLGDLGERYGSEHVYQNMRTPAEAIKLLCLNFPELQKELQTAHEQDIGYTVVQAGVAFSAYEELDLPLGKNDLLITPVLVGSGGGGGLGRIFAGIGLVAAAFFTGGATIGLLGLAAPVAASTVLAGAGAALILSGASQALASTQQSLVQGGATDLVAPQVRIPTLSGTGRIAAGQSIATDGPQSIIRGSDGRQSYAYQGAANTVGVGATIPVAYGKVLSGSHLLSATVSVTDDSDPLSKYIKAPGPQTVTVGGETISGLTRPNGLRTRQWNEGQFRRDISEDIRTLTLSIGNSVRPRRVGPFTDINRSNFQVFFEIDRGLFDYVSGPGSTLVDGYITYQVETVHDDSGAVSSLTTSTVQGLLLRNQKYRWMHFIEYAKISTVGLINTKVTILDFRAHPSCRLRVRQVGHNMLLLPKSYNYPPVDG